jgi:hypothetical protein
MPWLRTNSFHQSDYDDDDFLYDARSDSVNNGPGFENASDTRQWLGLDPASMLRPPVIVLPHEGDTVVPEGTRQPAERPNQATTDQQNVITMTAAGDALVNPWRRPRNPPPPPPLSERPAAAKAPPAAKAPSGPPPPPGWPPPVRSSRTTTLSASLWAPPSDHLCNVRRLNWTPQIGQLMIPYRLVDQIVWARSVDGQDGIGHVVTTYAMVDRIEHTMARSDCVEVFAINDQVCGPPILYWRPWWVSWMPEAPHPVWIVRWLAARY